MVEKHKWNLLEKLKVDWKIFSLGSILKEITKEILERVRIVQNWIGIFAWFWVSFESFLFCFFTFNNESAKLINSGGIIQNIKNKSKDNCPLMETIQQDIANQEGENQNSLPSLKPIPIVSSLLQENISTGYKMPHHNQAHWQIIQEKLQPIAQKNATWEDIIKTIYSFTNDEQFQSNYRKKEAKAMENMLEYFRTQLDEDTKIAYQKDLFPKIAQLILETEELFPLNKRIPIFIQDERRIGSLTKKQCACLIAHMVFCINVDQAEGLKLPDLIDFSAIYLKTGLTKSLTKKVQKIKCILTYLKKVLDEKPQGNVVFERLALDGTFDCHRWEDCEEERMTKVELCTEGNIEDQHRELQVVFSDNKLGDHVLQIAATQQQIMGLIHPEIMLSILFFEELQKDETVRVYGAGRYSNHKGYGDTFEFMGAYTEEKNPTERFHVIMDAEKYHLIQASSQFGEDWVLRELNKAYCGFTQEEYKDERRVATGRWGCGVFKGNPQLKLIVQWLAASRTNRGLVFYTNGDAVNFVNDQVTKILNYYTGKKVHELYEDLMEVLPVMREVLREDETKNLFEPLIQLRRL